MQIRKIKPYQFVELECKELVAEGVGLSYFKKKDIEQDFKPLTAFIRGVLPGEHFVAKVLRVKSKFLEGVLANQADLDLESEWIGKTAENTFCHKSYALFSLSEERIEAPCENFLACGGCKLQMIPYKSQVEYKKNWLLANLKGSGVAGVDVQLHESPSQTGYRNHVQVHINKYKQRGFYAPGSYRTVPFPSDTGCLLFNQEIFDRDFPAHLELVRCVRARIDQSENKADIWEYNSKEDKAGRHTATVSYPAGSMTKVTFAASSFFQVNSGFLPTWLELIASYMFTNQRPARLLELFSGIGFIGKMLQLKYELNCLGIDQLKEHEHQQTSFENSHYQSKGTYDYIQANLFSDKGLADSIKAQCRSFEPDICIVNPPRSGVSKNLINELSDSGIWPRQILYSSCNSSTFARDAEQFMSLGYQMSKVHLLDFFPMTSHFEVLANFTK